MNSSSDPAQPALSYTPLEYRDASVPFSTEDECTRQSSETDSVAAPAPPPDPGELLDARIEEERKAITNRARQESEHDIQRARAAIATAITQFAQQRNDYFRQAEAEVVQLVLAIARRLVHRESQIDPRLLAGLVSYELEQLEAATKVRLFVSPDTFTFWSEALETMPRPVELTADKTLVASEARIETALGSTTVSFERELKEIERGFFDLLAHRPAPAESKAVRVQ